MPLSFEDYVAGSSAHLHEVARERNLVVNAAHSIAGAAGDTGELETISVHSRLERQDALIGVPHGEAGILETCETGSWSLFTIKDASTPYWARARARSRRGGSETRRTRLLRSELGRGTAGYVVRYTRSAEGPQDLTQIGRTTCWDATDLRGRGV